MWLTLNQILTAFGSKTKAPLKVILKNATFASGLFYNIGVRGKITAKLANSFGTGYLSIRQLEGLAGLSCSVALRERPLGPSAGRFHRATTSLYIFRSPFHQT